MLIIKHAFFGPSRRAQNRKKENKISGYRNSEFEIDEFWFVLLIGSLSSVSSELNGLEDDKMDSKFDRVYLMADFDAEIVRVK